MKTEKFPLPLRIGVIADTHGRLPERVAAALAGADEIWHLGDFCDLPTYERCSGLGPPFFAVLGNNDYDLDLPVTLCLERHGKSFTLIHIPPVRPGGTDFLVHGHTHVPRDERMGATRIFNPGSVGKANKGAPPSFAWLTLGADGSVDWKVVVLA